MPQAIPVEDTDAALFEATPAAPLTPPPPSNAGKTPEQIAKEKRIEELRNESTLACCGDSSDGDILYYAPHFAISMVALIMLFIVSDTRKNVRRTGWRSWLRGRF